MAKSVRSMMLAASVFVMPAAGVLAQTTTAPTADHSQLGTANTGPSAHPTSGAVGVTGTKVVPGNNSTAGADRAGTAMGKTNGAADGGGK